MTEPRTSALAAETARVCSEDRAVWDAMAAARMERLRQGLDQRRHEAG